MLTALVRLALERRGIVLVLALLLLVYGSWSALHAPLDVFPDFAPPQVVVQTEAPGLDALEVEAVVTRPIEASLNGLSGLDSLRSQSIQGLSIITTVFREGTDVYRARAELAENLAVAAARLPAGIEPPRMTPLTSATMDLLKVGLVSDGLSPLELRDFAQWTLRPRLLAVPGVAGVSVFGGQVRELQIQVDPVRLELAGLSWSAVVEGARSASGVRGAGFVDTANQRVIVHSEGQLTRKEELEQVVLAERDGGPLRIRDVARVVDGAEPAFGDALVQGRPGVLLTMLSQYGANTMDVTHGVEAALDEMRPAIAAAGIELYDRLHRPATFIEHALANIREALGLGAVLVVIVLFLFLYNVRTALISATAIPLSLCAAVVALERLGASINTITLGGLAIALGEVVDDAIIDVENIFRRLREERSRGGGRSAFRIALEASVEVRSAVVHATLVVGLIFLPVLFLSGLQGRLFAPLAQAYLLAVGASLLVALTVTPALCLWLLPRAAERAHEMPLLALGRRLYLRLLSACAGHARLLLAGAALVCLLPLGLLARLGSEFVPDFREGHFVLHASAVPGTSLEEMRRTGASISQALLANPHIATVEQQIGRAELGEDPWGPNRSEFHVELAPLEPEVEAGVEDEIRAVLASTPGIVYDVLTFLGDRIGETISGETASVVVSVFGEDLDAIDREAEAVARLLESVPGAVDVQTASMPAAPTLAVQLLPERLAELGFAPVPVLEAVQTAVQGTRVAELWEGDRVRGLKVVLDPAFARDPESLGELRLRNAAGASARLAQLADIHPTSERTLLLHDGGRRRQTVTCNVEGRDIGSFVAEARGRAASAIRLAPGTYLSWGGAAEAEASSRRELLLYALLALVGIGMVLSLVFREGRNLLLVLANLPFALVGGVVAAWLQGGAVSIGVLVGFVTLLGISMRNSIMMVAHYEHLVAVEGQEWSLATALRGASERFSPIVMTALVTGLGLLPLALDSGRAGREIEGPMAGVILGGLISSTLLNLFVLPTLALRYGRFRAATRT